MLRSERQRASRSTRSTLPRSIFQQPAKASRALLRRPRGVSDRPASAAGRGQTAGAAPAPCRPGGRPCRPPRRSEEHTSELQSLMRISYAVFCLKKKKQQKEKKKKNDKQTRKLINTNTITNN